MNDASSNVIVEPTAESLTRPFGTRFSNLVRRTVEQRGSFSLFLAGGGTPRPFYRHLASEEQNDLPWKDLHLFWGDERFVPLDHEDSNYRMARETLIDEIPIPDANVHPVNTGARSVQDAAREYAGNLQEHLQTDDNTEIPRPDLILLGLGTDGHTASLFPNAPQLNEDQEIVCAVPDPPEQHEHQRVTITYPLINNSRHVWFLVTGERKRDMVRNVLLDNSVSVETYPAAGVQPENDAVWWLDEAACPSSLQ